ncbi:MAG: amidohydrolase family protein [Eubacteriales bacterium]|jgi:5-methylthioadenosine/S-adenosylhomocysteine deaminase
MNYLFEKVTVVSADTESQVDRVENTAKTEIISDAYVLVEDGKISSVDREPPQDFTGSRIDGRNKVLMPGLINAHTHLPMTAFRGYADDYDLHTWLNSYIFPAEDKLTDSTASVFSDLALAEIIASGTTSLSDMYFFSDTIASRVAEAGLKANISRAIVSFDDDYDIRTDKRGQELIDLVNTWHGYDSGRILIEAAVHAEYTSFPKVWTSVSEYASERGLRMHIHLSETKSEHEACIEKYGMTPASILNKYGIFNVSTSAAHCVYVDRDDIELLRQKGVSVIHNPISNMKLASGICPVSELLSSRINVALGTDSVSSNNSHDIFEEMKCAALVAKIRTNDPSALKAAQVLRMATVGGAIAQGRSNECGALYPGMDADLILVDFDNPHLIPSYNPVSNIVYSARGCDVVMNMVRGRIVYKDGEFFTIDLERVKRQARAAANIFR